MVDRFGCRLGPGNAGTARDRFEFGKNGDRRPLDLAFFVFFVSLALIFSASFKTYPSNSFPFCQPAN